MLTEKDYCDYDTCVALKELGYKVPTSAYYMPKNSQLIFVINQFRGGVAMDCFYSNNSLPKECMASDFIDAPTMWEAQKWLREEKKIDVFVRAGILENRVRHYYAEVFTSNDVIIIGNYGGDFDSYEEALLEGIKEAAKLWEEEKEMRNFEIWVEGFCTMESDSRAWKEGEQEAKTFEEACDLYAERHPSFKSSYRKQDGQPIWWGCRLFDNEADARKSFG